jgi:hypothetical protein
MTSNGKSETSSIAPPESGAAATLLEAWREALAGVLESERRQWQRERALIEAQADGLIAEMRAACADVRADIFDMVRARLAELKDGAPGEAGPIGPAGPQGEAGAGIEGPAGAAGPAGPQGPAGESIKGERGEGGEQGPQGPPGESLAGPEGPRGQAGLDGKDGAPGELPPVKAWAEGVHYTCEVVAHLGGTWQALKDTGHAPPHADWLQLASAGRDALGPTIRGTYATDGKYKKFDIVALNGSSFIARADEPGECPGGGWQLIASAGRPGKPGLKGDQGERGAPGEMLRRVELVAITKWDIDRASYRATPVLSDGSKAPALELRALFEQFQSEAE